jgi:hypothetical protein
MDEVRMSTFDENRRAAGRVVVTIGGLSMRVSSRRPRSDRR